MRVYHSYTCFFSLFCAFKSPPMNPESSIFSTMQQIWCVRLIHGYTTLNSVAEDRLGINPTPQYDFNDVARCVVLYTTCTHVHTSWRHTVLCCVHGVMSYLIFEQCYMDIGASFHLKNHKVIFWDFQHEVLVLKRAVRVQNRSIPWKNVNIRKDIF